MPDVFRAFFNDINIWFAIKMSEPNSWSNKVYLAIDMKHTSQISDPSA